MECTGVSRLVCLDVHNPTALDNAFRIPVDHLSAIPMFVRHFSDHLPDANLAVASPDVGGVKRAQIFRELLSQRMGREIDLVFVEKRRAAGIVSGGTVVGPVTGRTVIVLDDLCASGGTLIRAAASLRSAGAAAVHVAFTHAPLTRGLSAVCSCAEISSVFTTDSVSLEREARWESLTEMHVAPLFAEAIDRMIAGAPLAPLLQHWPPIGN
jgi:ribose-phosphate pyrophosphokinase